jgi:hypothetical protein
MARIAPFHSSKRNSRKVYHDDSECTEGRRIEVAHRLEGTGGHRHCEHCKQLEAHAAELEDHEGQSK